jgi:hypothetical protein
MFLCNLHHQWNLPGGTPPGAVVHVAAFDSARRTEELRSMSYLLYDPGAYLWGLPKEDCGRTCVYLATYPWVPIELPGFEDVEATKRKTWRDDILPKVLEEWPPRTPSSDSELAQVIDECLEWQIENGASRVILPATLVRGPDDMDTYIEWLDTGLRVASGKPIGSLAAVPLASSACASVLEQMLDVLSSRDELTGIYVTVESTTTSRYLTDRDAVRALLELSFHLGHRAGVEVVVNFADLFGLACLGAGAAKFATGYFGKDRQLNLADFVEGEPGGGAYPRLLSVASCCRFRSGRDLGAIRDNHLLGQFVGDQTEASRPLLDALSAGREAADVPGWAETSNNTALARSHLVELLVRAGNEVTEAGDLKAKAEWVFSWLQSAEMLCGYLQRRFSDDPLDEMGAWTGLWRSVFEDFGRTYGLI